jgi:hypothetical protein
MKTLILNSLFALDELKSLKAVYIYLYSIDQILNRNVTEVKIRNITKALHLNRKTLYGCLKILKDLNMIEIIIIDDERYLRPVIFPGLWNVNNSKIDKIITKEETEQERELRELDEYIKKLQSKE